MEARGSVEHSAQHWHTLDALWRRGSLSHLLDQTQLEIYNFIRSSKSKTVYVNASRQLGKSFVDVVIAIEDCLRNPGARVNYIAKTFGSLKKMIEQTMGFIIEQAPPDCRPVFNVSESRWQFPVDGPAVHGFIQLVGADETRGADRCRGGSVVTNIVDEAGFIDCLEYLLNSVIKPMGLRSDAVTILSSSPAFTPDHYSCEIEDACYANGALIKRDYWSPGLLSFSEKTAFLEAEARALNLTVEQFKKTTTYRREYGCERVLDETLAVVPEFAEAKDRIVVERHRPPHYDLYISIDPGMDDLTGILFAVTDFRRSRLIVEHELLLAKANTRDIFNAISGVLASCYPSTYEDKRSMLLNEANGIKDVHYVVRPYSTIADDTHKRLSADLHEYHGFSCSPAAKDDSEGAINLMRLTIQAGQTEIHPRCTGLVRQLSNAVRVKPGGDMARSKRDGHYDLVDAFKYLVRSWNRSHNPYPDDFDFDPQTETRRERPKPQTLGQVMLRGTNIGRRR